MPCVHSTSTMASGHPPMAATSLKLTITAEYPANHGSSATKDSSIPGSEEQIAIAIHDGAVVADANVTGERLGRCIGGPNGRLVHDRRMTREKFD